MYFSANNLGFGSSSDIHESDVKNAVTKTSNTLLTYIDEN